MHPIQLNTGPLASAEWLLDRGLAARPRWFVEISFGDAVTRFCLEIYAEEWGFWFRHREAMSWIRVTDIPFVHGRDDFALLGETPPLRQIERLIRALERRYRVVLAPEDAVIRTNLDAAETAIRAWLGAM